MANAASSGSTRRRHEKGHDMADSFFWYWQLKGIPLRDFLASGRGRKRKGHALGLDGKRPGSASEFWNRRENMALHRPAAPLPDALVFSLRGPASFPSSCAGRGAGPATFAWTSS